MECSLIRSQRFFVFQPLQNVKNVCLPTEYKVGAGGAGGVRGGHKPQQE